MKNLELEIKKVIIDSLNLEGMTPEDIDSATSLFGDGLGLDSIDALELGLALKNISTYALSPPLTSSRNISNQWRLSLNLSLT